LATPKNSGGRPVTKLCLALETFRRTDEGRVRDAKAFLGHFFPTTQTGKADRLFLHLPNEVRADLLCKWGIRGKKSALRDDDTKVLGIVSDALDAGDIDATIIEEGVSPEILIDWIPLEHWWSFWRGTSVPLTAVRKALGLARELGLFDDKWFIDHLRLPSQKLEKTDVLCAGLAKDQLVAWMHAVHENGDATPAGLVRALGWETILARTAEAALGSSLDALAIQLGLGAADGGPEKAPKATQDATATATAPKSSPSGSFPKVSAPPAPPAIGRAPIASAIPPRSLTPVGLPAVVVQTAVAAAPPVVTAPVVTAPPVVTVPPVAPVVVVPAPPASNPPNARVLFGSPSRELPPMRPPAATLSGVGGPTPEEELPLVSVSLPTTPQAGGEPGWEPPPRAEPGDMGWDLVHGVSMSISNLQPKYNFEADDEPTSDVSLPREPR
jgi:hypothetical protein